MVTSHAPSIASSEPGVETSRAAAAGSLTEKIPALCSIAGLGYYLPDGILNNDHFVRIVDTSDEWIVERTGIHSRHYAAPGEATSDLALKAAMAALADAKLEAKDLDLILLATSTPDTPVPSTACHLHAKLGLDGSSGVPAMDVAAGCSGFGYAMQMATACVKSGMHRRVLVVGADCLTRITNYADRQSCILFGDGAGAAVVTGAGVSGPAGTCATSGTPGETRALFDVLYTDVGADGTGAGFIRIEAGGSRIPASADSVAAHQHVLALRGRDVFKSGVRQMSESVRGAAAALGLTLNDFDLVIPHQANARIMEAVGSQLGVAPERLVIDIAETGNMAAASIPVALGRARERGQLRSGQLIVVVGFGSGLTWACQVLRVR